ncbi:MAG TPA: GAF domain-containing protein [Solirubrobacteraceae bacterium]|nr:GAF domain-containing protein [Solirubrobacteraceae bacterium]
MNPVPTAQSEVREQALLGAVRRLAGKTAKGAAAAELAASVAEEIIGLLDAHSSAVFRFDGDEIVVVGGSTAPGWRMFTRGARFPLERQMVAAQILATGQPARHAHYADDPSDAARRVTAIGYDVVIGAPVHVGGELWGIIYAGAKGTERLPEGSERELSVFADLCAIAVASAEDRARLESQTIEQQALMRVARAVLERAPEADVLAAITREAAALLDASAAALFCFTDDGGSEAVARWPSDVPVEDAGTAVEQVARDRRHVHAGDPDETAGPREHLVLGRPVWWAAPIEIGEGLWGTLVVATETGSPLPHDAADRVARFAELCSVAIADVKGRRDLLEQLVETRRLATLVELSQDFIAIADFDGMTSYLNPGGRRLVGLESLDEARTKSILDYLTPAGQEHFLEVSGPVTRRTGSFSGETTLRHFRTGEEIPVGVNAFTITHPVSGEPIATAIVQHALRERKRAERELRERADEVEQLAAARRFLLVESLRAEERMRRKIADVLHDDVLQELYAARLDLDRVPDDAEATHRSVAAVEAASRRLREAVSDLHPAAASTHDLEARLRSVLELGGNRAGFGYRLTFGEHEPCDVDELVVALLREFVHNAVKHADATFLVVTVGDEDGRVVLEVSDDGRGMAPDRPAEALRDGHIGLASSRERVEAVGGRLSLDSAPGAGTRIRVVVPRDHASAAPA